MESVEHMTHALQVAAKAMRAARENERPQAVMDLLEQSRQRILHIAKKEADVDIESNGVKALQLIVDGDFKGALEVLQESQTQWRQRGVVAGNAAQALEASRDKIVATGQVHPAMAQETYDYLLKDLTGKVAAASELAEDYATLETDALKGAQALGITV